MAKEATPEEKLRALFDLQIIDSKIDKIRIIRGELPLEVQDLEDEVAGLNTRLEKLKTEKADLDTSISDRKNQIKESEALIKKYKEQQAKVRNNREYDSITKEMEFQTLEIQLSEKRIKEARAAISNKEEIIASSEVTLTDRTADLDVKKSELNEITSETQKEEEILMKESATAAKVVDERLLNAYHRIRRGSKNGLAVVAIDRDASGGSFIKIPPQRILEVGSRKKIIVDEYSGRILVDKELADEEMERIEKKLKKLLSK